MLGVVGTGWPAAEDRAAADQGGVRGAGEMCRLPAQAPVRTRTGPRRCLLPQSAAGPGVAGRGPPLRSHCAVTGLRLAPLQSLSEDALGPLLECLGTSDLLALTAAAPGLVPDAVWRTRSPYAGLVLPRGWRPSGPPAVPPEASYSRNFLEMHHREVAYPLQRTRQSLRDSITAASTWRHNFRQFAMEFLVALDASLLLEERANRLQRKALRDQERRTRQLRISDAKNDRLTSINENYMLSQMRGRIRHHMTPPADRAGSSFRK